MLNTLIFIFMAIVGGGSVCFNAPKYTGFLSYGNFTVNVNIIYRCMINFILLFLQTRHVPQHMHNVKRMS